MARTGRRPGKQDTRKAILDAARDAFAEGGYDQASIRAIATAAGVDPALVHHYFGNKEQLFLATVALPLNPADVLSQVVAGRVEDIPERLVRAFLGVWDHPVKGPAAAAVVRTALQHEWSTRLLREFLVTQILRRVVSIRNDLDPEAARLRATLAASQMLGMAIIRYVLRVEPMASAPVDQLVAALVPTLRRYIIEPMPELFGESVGTPAEP